ncbi:hypothetical protein J5J10_04365 [Ciceribacter sp. L1K23]|uniref:hypothetical protein n=1 Tax=unclassified Ciceribacter TaxID=2628820 RepID=UPI001ABE152A|nr:MULTISPECIES: hypothetical protein [unclassified Ciceribacter]MBO3761021.1 hypothetical protein [Ciceribacter sp. L1K22]MBR0554907.1 hypothetical protein [Ciceribacter sp. L1K23]
MSEYAKNNDTTKKETDEDPGVITASPDAHRREKAGADKRDDKPAQKPATDQTKDR